MLEYGFKREAHTICRTLPLVCADSEPSRSNLGLYNLGMATEKPWGSIDVWMEGERFTIGKLLLREGERTSLHLHEGQSHFWFVESGNGELVVEETKFLVGAGDSIYIEVGQLHRLSAMLGEMEVFFVNAGIQDQGDVVRFEDDYGRVNEGIN